MSNIVFMCDGYLPYPNANGVCVDLIVNELLKRGHNVKVISFNNNNNIESKTIKRNLEVIYIRPSRYYARLINENYKESKFKKLFLNFINLIKYPQSDYFVVSDYTNIVMDLIKKNKCDLIVSVNSPIQSISASLKIKSKINKPIILYFLDPIYKSNFKNSFIRNYLNIKRIKFEKKVFKQFKNICIMNSSYNYYKKYNKELNVFDIPTIHNYNIQKTFRNSSNEILIIFSGSISKDIRNPRYFFEIVNRSSLRDNLHIIFYGSIYDSSYGNCNNINIEFKKSIQHDLLIQKLGKADYLLNLGNNCDSMVPSKIFEYISIGRPILNFYVIDNDTSDLYLTKYPLYFKSKQNFGEDYLNKETKKFDKFILEHLNNNVDFNDIRNIYKNNTVLPFVEFIESKII